MKKTLGLVAALLMVVGLSSCTTEADTVNANLDKEAEKFQIQRRIVFVNGITDKYMLVIEGRCSLEYGKTKIDVTCKVDNEYKRHTLVRSDNVFAVSEQVVGAAVDPNHYVVNFRPQTLVPSVDVDTDSTG